MITVTVKCELQMNLQGNPTNDAIAQVVEKMNMALAQADLTAKPFVIGETIGLVSIQDKFEDAKKWYQTLSEEEQDKLFEEAGLSGDDDFYDWLVEKREAEICIHKHCSCK